ncbi:hypothetical protein K443DRAFT_5494 [Laccaria amethystina LaAM-08-1]|uniref:Crinkler effector protein N-terminal domain-containing protein n=1 Tax=Laccaria amethystina LaAM-08-1 TaxID=1095629 RepID=A0A0C9XZR4_9AGAR|nr:hypothetical protein K443DRAFT_5494 [Laccaria amethystina LaAM-08-1]
MVEVKRFWCILLDDSPNEPFTVNIGLDKQVFDLMKMIESSLNRMLQYDAQDIPLYKLTKSIPTGPTSTLFQRIQDVGDIQSFASRVDDTSETLSDLFPDAVADRMLHFLVKLPLRTQAPPTQNDSLNEVPGRGMKRRHSESDDLITERMRLAKMAKCAPSSLSKPSAFQTSAQQVVTCNRPFDFDTIPITLLQEEFGLFMDELAACKWYENKTQRRSKIQKVFDDVAGLYLSAETIRGTEYTTDGNLRVNIMPAVIRECKNEAGCGLLEAIAFYVQFLVKALDRHGIRNRFPCILLIDTGSCFGLYGCLWTGEHLHVEPLTPFYDLTIHWTDESGRQAIAASLDAFLKAIPRLEAHYAQLASNAPVPPLLDRAYPYKTNYEDENGRHINFSYRSRTADKLVFVAEPDKSSDKDLGILCVKFTRRYSEDAHRFLAQLGYAPRLQAVMRLPGGWNMVVMDYSEYTQLCDPMLQISDELRRTIVAKVSEAVQKLHDAGFVHGDIRSLNVLVDCRMPTSKDGIKIHFIDFDWAGRQGEAVYPMRVNRVTVRRPEGVSDGKPILVEHDMAMWTLVLIRVADKRCGEGKGFVGVDDCRWGFCTFGYIFIWGIYRDYHMNEFPKLHSPNKLALIGSLQFALPFLLAFLAGKAINVHFHWVVLPGSAFFGMLLFLLSFIDPESFMHGSRARHDVRNGEHSLRGSPSAELQLMQLYSSLPSRPSPAIQLTMMMVSNFLLTKGFSGAVRITAYMVLACLVIGNNLTGMLVNCSSLIGLISNTLPSDDDGFYRTFIVLLTMYFPASYIKDYSGVHDVGPHLAFYALEITNITSLMAHSDGSPGGQAWIIQLVDPHHGVVSRRSLVDFLTASQSVKAMVIVSDFHLELGFHSLFLGSLAIRATEIG